MKNRMMRKFWGLALVLVLVATPATNVAAGVLSTNPSYGTASANVPELISFTVSDSNADTDIVLRLEAAVSGTLAVRYATSGTEIDSWNFTAADMAPSSTGEYYILPDSWTLAAGNYTLVLTFSEPIYYEVIMYQGASISARTLSVTKGFSKKLTVSDAAGNVTWKSSNTKVATVKNGKVTGKKKGTATITATGRDSEGMPFVLQSKVTVQNNVYTESKMTVSDTSYGDKAAQVYKASFDAKGNLVVKARVINNSGHNYEQIKGITITVKNAKGKTVATYKQSKRTVSIPTGTTKDFTFKIAKKNLKIKANKADLVGGDATFKGTGIYYSY